MTPILMVGGPIHPGEPVQPPAHQHAMQRSKQVCATGRHCGLVPAWRVAAAPRSDARPVVRSAVGCAAVASSDRSGQLHLPPRTGATTCTPSPARHPSRPRHAVLDARGRSGQPESVCQPGEYRLTMRHWRASVWVDFNNPNSARGLSICQQPLWALQLGDYDGAS